MKTSHLIGLNYNFLFQGKTENNKVVIMAMCGKSLPELNDISIQRERTNTMRNQVCKNLNMPKHCVGDLGCIDPT